MKISLITPSFNHDEFIQRTIDSVLGQTGDFELEYIAIKLKTYDILAIQEVVAGYGGAFERFVSIAASNAKRGSGRPMPNGYRFHPKPDYSPAR